MEDCYSSLAAEVIKILRPGKNFLKPACITFLTNHFLFFKITADVTLYHVRHETYGLLTLTAVQYRASACMQCYI